MKASQSFAVADYFAAQNCFLLFSVRMPVRVCVYVYMLSLEVRGLGVFFVCLLVLFLVANQMKRCCVHVRFVP